MISIISEVHASILWIIPFCLEIPTLIPWTPSYLLRIPPLCRGANFRPLWSLVGCILTLPPFPPHSPFPNGSPFQIHVLLRRHCDIGFTQSNTYTLFGLIRERQSKSWTIPDKIQPHTGETVPALSNTRIKTAPHWWYSPSPGQHQVWNSAIQMRQSLPWTTRASWNKIPWPVCTETIFYPPRRRSCLLTEGVWSPYFFSPPSRFL